MQQPEIEFLATYKFGITQTGSRLLNDLKVSWKGNGEGTYQSGEKNSDLFGEAVQAAYDGSLYIDVSDDSLSFTGNSTTLEAFTMGAYFWGPAKNNLAWWLIVPHKALFTRELYEDRTKWRLAMFIFQNTAESASLTYITNAGVPDVGNFMFTIPTELRAGWIHLAHSYNQNESGGTLRSYVNGNLVLTRSNRALKVYGSQGAYATLY